MFTDFMMFATLTDRGSMCHLTVRTVIQVNFCRFVLFHSNTTAEEQIVYYNGKQITSYKLQNNGDLVLNCNFLTCHETSPDKHHTQS